MRLFNGGRPGLLPVKLEPFCTPSLSSPQTWRILLFYLRFVIAWVEISHLRLRNRAFRNGLPEADLCVGKMESHTWQKLVCISSLGSPQFKHCWFHASFCLDDFFSFRLFPV